MAEKFQSVEDYIASFPAEVRAVLEGVRAILHEAVPGAEDVISYNMATISVDGRRIVHYAGWKHHLSLYPAPEGDEELVRDLAPYVSGRGTLKFPLDRPLPRDLIARVGRSLSGAAP